MLLDKIGIFIFTWIVSFLFHEFMHIKGQSVFKDGIIYVSKTGFTVTTSPLYYPVWFYYSGGILTSIVMFALVFVSTGWWQWCWFTLGWVQLCYGIYEGYKQGNVKNRYYIYLAIVLISLVIYLFQKNLNILPSL